MMKRIISAAILVLMLSVPSLGLSDSDYLNFKKDSDFDRADKELTQAYNEARNSMTKEDFYELRSSQRQWISSGRDEHAKRLFREGYSIIDAYTEATLARVQEIRNSMTLSTLSNDDIQGYYDNGDDVYLYIGWKNRSSNILEVSLSSYGENWKGTGTLKGTRLTANYGGTSVIVSVIDDDTLELKPNSAFRRAVGFDASGEFRRHYGK